MEQSRPESPGPDHQRRFRGPLRLASGPRTPTHPSQLPERIRPSSLKRQSLKPSHTQCRQSCIYNSRRITQRRTPLWLDVVGMTREKPASSNIATVPTYAKPELILAPWASNG